MIRLCALALSLGLLVAALAGCGGGSSRLAPAAPLPLWQRVLESGELTGFLASDAPPRMLELPAFVEEAKIAFVQITPEEARTELIRDGYKRALISPLWLPEHPAVGAASTVVELGSAAQANRMRDWFAADNLLPCPETCDVTAAPFEVPGVPGAKASRRTRNLALSDPSERLFDSYDVEFTDGRFFYDVFVLAPRVGLVSKSAVVAAATALYERVHGRPPLPERAS